MTLISLFLLISYIIFNLLNKGVFVLEELSHGISFALFWSGIKLPLKWYYDQKIISFFSSDF